MTELKFAILGFIYQSPNREVEKVALYNQNLGSVKDVRAALEDMLNMNKPLIIKPIGKRTFKLTPHGSIAYELAQEECCKQAKEKEQQRFNNQISIASVLVPLITFIVGLVVEFCTNVIDRIFSLFV